MASDKGTVLIVDDHAVVRDSLRRILTRRGYQVETAGTAEQALALLAQQLCDLVVTDLQMPGMDGLALLGKIKERAPHIPVVMITAHASTDVVIRALRSGVTDFVTKPFKARELLDIIERELARHRYEGPAAISSGIGYQLSRQQLDQIDRQLAQLRAEIQARCILVIEANGHVLGTKGIIKDMNLSALAALVAGDFAATSNIATLIGEGESFRLNYHEGERYNAYSAQVTPDVFLVIIFGQEVKLGAVLYYTKQMLPQLEEIIGQAIPVPSKTDDTPSTPDEQEAPRMTLDEIMESGLLDDDALASLDAQFAGLWASTPEDE